MPSDEYPSCEESDHALSYPSPWSGSSGAIRAPPTLQSQLGLPKHAPINFNRPLAIPGAPKEHSRVSQNLQEIEIAYDPKEYAFGEKLKNLVRDKPVESHTALQQHTHFEPSSGGAVSRSCTQDDYGAESPTVCNPPSWPLPTEHHPIFPVPNRADQPSSPLCTSPDSESTFRYPNTTKQAEETNNTYSQGQHDLRVQKSAPTLRAEEAAYEEATAPPLPMPSVSVGGTKCIKEWLKRHQTVLSSKNQSHGVLVSWPGASDTPPHRPALRAVASTSTLNALSSADGAQHKTLRLKRSRKRLQSVEVQVESIPELSPADIHPAFRNSNLSLVGNASILTESSGLRPSVIDWHPPEEVAAEPALDKSNRLMTKTEPDTIQVLAHEEYKWDNVHRSNTVRPLIPTSPTEASGPGYSVSPIINTTTYDANFVNTAYHPASAGQSNCRIDVLPHVQDAHAQAIKGYCDGTYDANIPCTPPVKQFNYDTRARHKRSHATLRGAEQYPPSSSRTYLLKSKLEQHSRGSSSSTYGRSSTSERTEVGTPGRTSTSSRRPSGAEHRHHSANSSLSMIGASRSARSGVSTPISPGGPPVSPFPMKSAFGQNLGYFATNEPPHTRYGRSMSADSYNTTLRGSYETETRNMSMDKRNVDTRISSASKGSAKTNAYNAAPRRTLGKRKTSNLQQVSTVSSDAMADTLCSRNTASIECQPVSSPATVDESRGSYMDWDDEKEVHASCFSWLFCWKSK